MENLSNEELVKLHDSNIVAGLTIHSFKAAANTRKELLSRLNRLEEVEKENKELKAWKESMLSIEATWDKQKVAELLGIGLGESIVENIEPKIIGLRKQVENLECCGNCLADGCKYKHISSNRYCRNWKSDTMTREDRK